MRHAVNKELYQLYPIISASCVSVASRVVNPMRDELYRKMRWVCKLSNNLKVLTVLLFVMLHTIMCTHTELLTDIDCAQC